MILFLTNDPENERERKPMLRSNYFERPRKSDSIRYNTPITNFAGEFKSKFVEVKTYNHIGQAFF